MPRSITRSNSVPKLSPAGVVRENPTYCPHFYQRMWQVWSFKERMPLVCSWLHGARGLIFCCNIKAPRLGHQYAYQLSFEVSLKIHALHRDFGRESKFAQRQQLYSSTSNESVACPNEIACSVHLASPIHLNGITLQSICISIYMILNHKPNISLISMV